MKEQQEVTKRDEQGVAKTEERWARGWGGGGTD